MAAQPEGAAGEPHVLPAGLLPRLWTFVRAQVRAHEVLVVALAALIGTCAGAAATAMGVVTQFMHELLFGLASGERLSASPALHSPWLVLVPAAGGVMMGGIALALKRWRPHAIVDPIEANALHGGQMSLTDSIILALQTMVSNGFGASLGLEAGYSQIGGGIASRFGAIFALRRNDMRILVGAGAAAGLGAAFDAPLMGAFYGFELIIGTYSIPAAIPVLAATLCGVVTARTLGLHAEPLTIAHLPEVDASQFVPFLLLGLVAAVVAIGIMRLVTAVEWVVGHSRLPAPLRTGLAGLAVGCLALYSPQVLSDGHGALHAQVGSAVTLSVVVILAFKVLASALSVGSGFRGGLFFASLFLGALMGKLYAVGVELLFPGIGLGLAPSVAAVVGMGALAVGVIGGPLTMSFLVLEMTGDLTLTGLVVGAAAVTSLTVRETFGYSFSTWRLHLRGETIRSAQDVGWMRSLTVAAMMRTDMRIFPRDGTLGGLRQAFPLGSVRLVVLVDDAGGYAGLVRVSEGYADHREPGTPVQEIARHADAMLLPAMNVKEAARAFEAAGAEELPVVSDYESRRLVGLLSESHVLRRYAERLDMARRGLGAED
ncbi:chloride channel protein [Xanthobacter agilis]|uniref:CIC family chloride channel protein n=1 Tax=Xanthobacter agilis TaxID=47492 RepID=A0ABU0LB12_XANAG|nr:chloride channel protein [Xanthobacter agilis]MDQ0504314.1 CIC family chloride channel protein [Xanthobacter agilis]